MKGRSPWKPDGRTFDQMLKDLQRAQDRKMWEAWLALWRRGDYRETQSTLDRPGKRRRPA